DDLSAAGSQAIYILRVRAHRPDMPMLSNWIPHLSFTHLVLPDYLGSELPCRFAVSPEDRYRLLWAGDPAGFDQGRYMPSPWTGAPEQKIWPYSSSYEIGPAFFAQDSASPIGLSQAGVHNQSYWTGSNGTLGLRRIDEVAYPSQ